MSTASHFLLNFPTGEHSHRAEKDIKWQNSVTMITFSKWLSTELLRKLLFSSFLKSPQALMFYAYSHFDKFRNSSVNIPRKSQEDLEIHISFFFFLVFSGTWERRSVCVCEGALRRKTLVSLTNVDLTAGMDWIWRDAAVRGGYFRWLTWNKWKWRVENK